MNTWTVPAHRLLAAQAGQLAAILHEVIPDPDNVDARRYIASNGGDHDRMRGIPAIGRNVAGAIPGTSPHAYATR